MVAANLLRGDVKTLTWDQVDTLDRMQYFIVDVRTPEELTIGMIDGAVNIPLQQLRSRINEIPKDRRILIYCQVGQRGYFASRILAQHGFDVYNLSGGFKTYSHAVGRQSNFDIFEHVTIDSKEEIREIVPPALAQGREFKLDACGLQCPGPILKLYNKMGEVEEGDIVTVTATDFGFTNDVAAWADKTGNKLLSIGQEGTTIVARVQKGLTEKVEAAGTAPVLRDKTIVVFSGELDKALAAFIIATGAAAMGRKVTMFFTFWGLNILRKENAPAVKKTLMEKLFGWMMPKGADRLKLSQLHMAPGHRDDQVGDAAEEYCLAAGDDRGRTEERRAAARLPDVDGHDGHPA